jgi:hypothetical protein
MLGIMPPPASPPPPRPRTHHDLAVGLLGAPRAPVASLPAPRPGALRPWQAVPSPGIAIERSAGATDSGSSAESGRKDEVWGRGPAPCSSLGRSPCHVPNKGRNERRERACRCRGVPRCSRR